MASQNGHDAVVAQLLLAGAEKAGWLEKKGQQLVKNWKMRYFVLEGNRLSYYAEERRPGTRKGTVRVRGVADVPDRPGKRQHRFNVLCDGSVLAVAAGDSRDKAAWAAALSQAAGQPLPQGTPGGAAGGGAQHPASGV